MPLFDFDSNLPCFCAMFWGQICMHVQFKPPIAFEHKHSLHFMACQTEQTLVADLITRKSVCGSFWRGCMPKHLCQVNCHLNISYKPC